MMAELVIVFTFLKEVNHVDKFNISKVLALKSTD